MAVSRSNRSALGSLGVSASGVSPVYNGAGWGWSAAPATCLGTPKDT